MCFELEGGQENSSFPANNQRAGFLHGSFLSQLSHVHRNLRGNGSPVLPTGKVSSIPWVQGPDGNIVPEEFVVEENLNYDKEGLVNEGVMENNETIRMLNLPPPPNADESSSETICHGPLTFDPLPHQEEGEDTQLATADDQTELMRWHYRLGHLPFSKLKQLALNGKIPKKLAKVKPPKYEGCLFRVMTKIPWQ